MGTMISIEDVASAIYHHFPSIRTMEEARTVIHEAPSLDLVTCGECCKMLSCIRACCVDSHSYCSDGIRRKRKVRGE